ncbi:hypothetical protein NDU88_002685 [Pleurodeles waltl]|uniref:Uncharacterized protein n=1 Tax=Pleurodeles waltl TaxID=8319 RepID=A0AAV7T437_PLEWA|nr:hypothetical protein NDU88_002685 [Pleurodeles waltl]
MPHPPGIPFCTFPRQPLPAAPHPAQTAPLFPTPPSACPPLLTWEDNLPARGGEHTMTATATPAEALRTGRKGPSTSGHTKSINRPAQAASTPDGPSRLP